MIHEFLRVMEVTTLVIGTAMLAVGVSVLIAPWVSFVVGLYLAWVERILK